jgi:hypothetical protein
MMFAPRGKRYSFVLVGSQNSKGEFLSRFRPYVQKPLGVWLPGNGSREATVAQTDQEKEWQTHTKVVQEIVKK